MITINDTLHTNADTAMLKAICPDTDSICFFDIETTGFSRNYNIVFRLAGAILEHMALAGEEKFSITHDVLARDMGTAREVVTRLLKQFQTEGYVRLSRGYIEVLDAKALKKI